ncbi:MAG: DedA family protein [Bacteroidales bacterium]|nr:DedA family protein [Bacteroidales bacterium]
MVEFLLNYGLIGLFVASFLASTVIPFSSEVVLTGVLFAGVNPLYAFFAATAGNWLGGLTSYYIGHLGRWDIIEKWLGVKHERLIKQKSKIEKYGSLIALLTWLPIIGDIFSIGLGFYRIDFIKSAFFMLIGRSLRFAGWVLLYILYEKEVFSYLIA